MAKKSTSSNKKRLVKVEAVGQAHVHSSFNNIIISLTNSTGQVISWSSAGKMGFRGSKRTLRMQLRWQLPIALRSHSIWGCVKLKYMFPVRVMAVNQLFVLFTPVVSK